MKKPFPHGRVVVDYETDGLHPYDGARPFIAGMEDEAGNVLKVSPSDHRLKKIIEDPKIRKISHGAKFEIKHSYHLGMKPAGKWDDTMAKAVLVNEYQRINLGALSRNWLKDDTKGIVEEWLDTNAHRIRKETGRDPNYKDVPPELISTYLEGDLDKTLRLDWLWRPVEEDPLRGKLYDMETDLAYDIADMEDLGFFIDKDYILKTLPGMRTEMKAIEAKLNDMAGVRFNPGSHAQLGEVMVGLGLDTGAKNKDGSMKTRFELLADMASHPFVDRLIRWRGLNKIAGTYLEPFLNKAMGDCVHGSLWQYGQDEGIVTGRMSSSDPNLQNMPGGGRSTNKVLIELGPKVRRAIVPPPGYAMVFFDFSKIEMVIFTCESGEERTIEDLKNGVDVYVAHGKILRGEDAFKGLSPVDFERERFRAKEQVLSLIYGQGLNSFARKARITLAEAKARRDAYFVGSPKTRQFMIQLSAKLIQNGFVTDRFGRRYHVPKELAYKATNAVCQGPAATVMKMAIVRSRKMRSLGFRPMFPVHDELIGICPKERVFEVMRTGRETLKDNSFPVPIPVESSWSLTNWAEKKKWKPGDPTKWN